MTPALIMEWTLAIFTVVVCTAIIACIVYVAIETIKLLREK